MSQTEDLKRFLSLLIYYVGGKENILSYTNCMTRLRIELKDVLLIKIEDIDTTEAPYRLFLKGNQLQVMLGPSLASLAVELIERDFAKSKDKLESVNP